MNQLKHIGAIYMALHSKRNQHFIDMDGFKVFYEQIGSRNSK